MPGVLVHAEPGALETVLPDAIGAFAEPAERLHGLFGEIEGDAVVDEAALERIIIVEPQFAVTTEHPLEVGRPAAAFEPGATGVGAGGHGYAARSLGGGGGRRGAGGGGLALGGGGVGRGQLGDCRAGYGR